MPCELNWSQQYFPRKFIENYILQFKYRIEAFEMLAACQGVFGRGIALDASLNRYDNDAGCRNTNKPGDLKVLKF